MTMQHCPPPPFWVFFLLVSRRFFFFFLGRHFESSKSCDAQETRHDTLFFFFENRVINSTPGSFSCW